MTPSNSGIYKILNTKTNKFYIGSAVYLDSRIRTHKANLNNNRHPNKHLQASYNKYSGWFFEFIILEYCEPQFLIEREQFYIDTLKPEYNVRKNAESNLGINFGKQTKDHIEKRMLKVRGCKHSEKARLNNSLGQKARNRKLSIEEKARLLSYAKPSSEQKKLKIGLANSRPDLWPHPNKSDCKCRECLDKKNFNKRQRTQQLNLMFAKVIFVEQTANV